jgi:uncharacterized membrane protein
MRKTVSILMVILGIGLSAVSYFVFAAPLTHSPMTVANSEPRVPFAPTLFILGIVLVFLAAVVYELMPEKEDS